MLCDSISFHSWGNPKNQTAEALYDAAPDPSSYNANYLQGQRGKKTPIAIPGESRLPNQNSPQWDANKWGLISAKASIEPLNPVFNTTYLKPDPKTQFKIPTPVPYSKENALKLLTEDETANEVVEEKAPIDENGDAAKCHCQFQKENPSSCEG